MTTVHKPTQNHLLAALPAIEFERLAPHLQLVPLKPGQQHVCECYAVVKMEIDRLLWDLPPGRAFQNKL